ncbi:MAG: hypothetical protein PSX81_02650 [bacterium]|nr:hypothetical protein [bacterium]
MIAQLIQLVLELLKYLGLFTKRETKRCSGMPQLNMQINNTMPEYAPQLERIGNRFYNNRKWTPGRKIQVITAAVINSVGEVTFRSKQIRHTS